MADRLGGRHQLDLDERRAVGVGLLRRLRLRLHERRGSPCAGAPARRRRGGRARRRPRAGRRPRRSRRRTGRGRAAGARRPRRRSGGYLPVFRSTTTTRPSSSTSSRSAKPYSATRWPSGSVTSARSSCSVASSVRAPGRACQATKRASAARTSSRSRLPDHGVRKAIRPHTPSTCAISSSTWAGSSLELAVGHPLGDGVHDEAEALGGGGRRRAAGLPLEEPAGGAGQQRGQRAGARA